MPQHLIELVLVRDNACQIRVEVCFEYQLSLQLSQWQYKRHGRIQLTRITNKRSGERVIDLSLEEHIRLKEGCRMYLESTLKPGTTVDPLFS